MEYKYADNGNYEDFSSGRVLYGGKGIPNFPVRLINEIFGRAAHHLGKEDELVVYDPCCGGGYSLTVLGFFYSDRIAKIYGSDVDENMIEHARKNLSLLQDDGLDTRKQELETLFDTYHKDSHREALESVEVLKKQLTKLVPSEVFVADCTKTLPKIDPDVIITDIPYGNLVNWSDGEGDPMNSQGALDYQSTSDYQSISDSQKSLDSQDALDSMLESLAAISDHEMILALSMDKKQKFSSTTWEILEKQNIGKRKFVIMRKS